MFALLVTIREPNSAAATVRATKATCRTIAWTVSKADGAPPLKTAEPRKSA